MKLLELVCDYPRNLIQERDSKFKYISHLFNIIGRVNVYIQKYRKDVGYCNFDSIAIKNKNE